MLINHGANVNVRSNAFDETALIVATNHNHEKVVSILLQAGADVHATDVYGYNAHRHATNQENPVTKELIEKAGGRAPPPIRYPDTIPWPETAENIAPTHDPIAVVRAYVHAQHEWDKMALQAMSKKNPNFNDETEGQLVADRLAYLSRYCTKRALKYYVPESIPLTEHLYHRLTDFLVSFTLTSESKAEIVSLHPMKNSRWYEHLYRVSRIKGEWRIDGVYTKVYGSKLREFPYI